MKPSAISTAIEVQDEAPGMNPSWTIASLKLYAVNGLFVWWLPLFRVPETLTAPSFLDYFSYAGLGLAAGLLATLVPLVFYGTRDVFRALRIPPHVKPAIGGLGGGLLAMAMPQVLGGGTLVVRKTALLSSAHAAGQTRRFDRTVTTERRSNYNLPEVVADDAHDSFPVFIPGMSFPHARKAPSCMVRTRPAREIMSGS
jgi:hypothetical protein